MPDPLIVITLLFLFAIVFFAIGYSVGVWRATATAFGAGYALGLRHARREQRRTRHEDAGTGGET